MTVLLMVSMTHLIIQRGENRTTNLRRTRKGQREESSPQTS
ncbi:hypothetical protein CsSME_00023303 [Camellia sinensis var. sinensis]